MVIFVFAIIPIDTATSTERDMSGRCGKPPIYPDRVRRIDKRGFAFVPGRFLHDGFLASLSHIERSLYLFLLLAGDRAGVSFYSYDRICTDLQITPDEYVLARNRLIDMDLLAFDGKYFQVLSLPEQPTLLARPPLRTRDDFERDDPATIRQLIRASLDER
jgi:hypothetical protein